LVFRCWDPFDLLWERDSSEHPEPISATPHPRSGRLREVREMAVIEIDTRLDENRHGLSTPGEVEEVIASTEWSSRRVCTDS
jgi:hypothetical protein